MDSYIQAVAAETVTGNKKGQPLVMSPNMRRHMLLALSAHIKEHLGNRVEGLRRYQKMVRG